MNKNFIILLLFLLPFFAGCEKGNDVSEQEEGILVSLHDVSLSINDSRATPAEIGKPVADYFNIRITNKKTNQQVYDGKYTDRLIKTSVGSYSVEAFYGDNPELAFDAPYYYGSTETEVRTDEISSAVLNCTVGNSLVSVNFVNKDIFDQIYSSYGLKVSVGASSMTIDSQKSDKSVYFKANSNVSLSFVGVLKNTSEDISYSLDESVKDIFPLQAAKHAIINLRASNVGISIEKLEVNDVSVNETIPLEWLPKPKMTSEGFSNNAISFAETEKKEVTVNLNLSSPLQELKFKINSADPRFSGLEDREYLMSNIEDKNAIETALGITLPEIGTTEANINFSSLIPQLLTDNGTTVESRIEIDAKANDRWISEGETDASGRTFTFTCNKPIFNVSVYPGNIWTKEFTINPLLTENVESGDYEILKKNMKYQFSVDGNSDWTDLGDDLRKIDLDPGTTYYVRGVYREAVVGKTLEITTYPQIYLKNSNLENYSIVKGEDGNKWNGYGAQFEWDNWATLNELTTPNCPITSYSYNTRSGTRPVSDVRPGSSDNTAVWIITVGYGYGGTNSSPKNITPSELFLGVYNTKGIEFKSRPTGVKFWYKYYPYLNDNSDIYIQVYSGENIIGSACLNQTNKIDTYTEYLMNIKYNDEYLNLEPDRLSLVFKSGFNNEVESRESGGLTSSNTANPKFRGSELYIDDISLVYDK